MPQSKGGRRQAGMALVLVLVIVTLLMGLVLAMLSMGSSESRASAGFSQIAQVRQLTDMPVSIVMGQIRQATTELGMAKTWASQPGMIRVFGNQAGSIPGRSDLQSVWRLYSAEKMVQAGDTFDALKEVESLAQWRELPAQFVDLNEPVAKLSGSGTVEYRYPIVDHSLLGGEGEPAVGKMDGFSLSASASVPGATPQQPLPMPVRWLYVLQDGRIVVPTGGEGGKAVFNAAEVTASNPIVSRIAFWTDDESCKVNINTAGEGTGWNLPRTSSWSDRNFAYFPPAQNEFQRYPGHPAMTSLGVVLQAFDESYEYQYPQVIASGMVANKESYTAWLGKLYALTPRLQLGAPGEGSRGGTEEPKSATGIPFKRERLFSTVDEFFYGSTLDSQGMRLPNAAGGLIDSGELEASRFFLTAHSRAPEVNLYNRPRISLWPVQADKAKRTAKDKLLNFCATTAGLPGGFQRASTWENNSTKQGSSQSQTADFQIARNQELLSYLQRLTKKAAPGFGSDTFDDKYGSLNRNQILLNMFDFIRWGVNGHNPYETPKYHYLPPRAYTKLNPEWMAESTAVPLTASGTPTEPYALKLKSFGHYPSVVEAAVVFMATQVEMASANKPKDVEAPTNVSDKTTKMQAFLILQPFIPAVGMPPRNPNVRYRVLGLENWKVNGISLGFGAQLVNRTWVASGATGDAGSATAYTSLNSHFYKARTGNAEKMMKAVAPGGVDADETDSFPFVSLEVDVSAGKTFLFEGGDLTIEIHTGSGPAGKFGDETLVQTFHLDFPTAGPWPVPTVRVDSAMSSNANWATAVNRMNLQARLNTKNILNNIICYGDTVRSVVSGSSSPIQGDYRLLCALKEVPKEYFAPHEDYNSPIEEAQSLRHAGSTYAGHYGRSHQVPYLTTNQGRQHVWKMAGYEIGPDKAVLKSYGLLRDVKYWEDCQPAVPRKLNGAYNTDGRPGDWDTGTGRIEDGPYINKIDDAGVTGNTTKEDDGYFSRIGFTEETTGRFYSPNRQICSAVAFGSLPSVIHADPLDGIPAPAPWQTLLFCPNPPSRETPSLEEPKPGDHFGFRPPHDHLLLDFFWMPVVEPYAISEPGSTAGKINLNSQIMPFSYIERNTGIHAVLRSSRISALPADLAWAKDALAGDDDPTKGEGCYKSRDKWLNYETVYGVNAAETMKGIRNRFLKGDIFRSASEICEIFLVPQPFAGRTYYTHPGGLPSSSPTYESMVSWWNGDLGTQKDGYELTGDNVRESPYNHLYPRLTTKSNTYTVHYRVQTLKKARSSSAATWDEAVDFVSAEQRGSVLLERYLDPNNEKLPDFIKNDFPEDALDDHYGFRVISKRTFAP
ncbi:Verru_Chthon cassette protein A [Verrucomicrobium spinosum]|uniref:Verru_Chthon cassette protein A n=1 Tax=Verrucomicrobium spinosum TaxID=2736 RepID=UPI0001746982|nr:Verru_Chthon cassette protein A [Verrucomicrobium spinosum]